MTTKVLQLQEPYLNVLYKEEIAVSVYLINGIKLSGLIASFDQSVIMLRDSNSKINQLIYKHAISTIVPTKPFAFETEKYEL